MKLTRSDLEKKRARLDSYIQKLNDLQEKGYDHSDKEHIGYHFNSSQIVYEEERQILLSFINKEKEDLEKAEIIDELEIPENIVGLGDKVTMLMQYDGEEPFEESLLVSDAGELSEHSVTTSSPIGFAIYGKEVGSTVQCQTPAGLLTITILEKTRGLSR